MQVNVQECFSIGNASERQVMSFFIDRGLKTTKVDHKTHNYDIEVVDRNDKVCNIEVKTFGKKGYATFFAETVQISRVNKIESTPEYLTHYQGIDYVVQYNRIDGHAYFFDCETLAKYVLANKDSERANWAGTAKGILIHMESEEAGYKYKKFIGIAA